MPKHLAGRLPLLREGPRFDLEGPCRRLLLHRRRCL